MSRCITARDAASQPNVTHRSRRKPVSRAIFVACGMASWILCSVTAYAQPSETDSQESTANLADRLIAPFSPEQARKAQIIWAERLATEVQVGKERPMVLIPAGEFTMGSPKSTKNVLTEEKQRHVRISQPFYLGIYEVTQGEFTAVMGYNPSSFSFAGRYSDSIVGVHQTDDRPVEFVNWFEAIAFCNKRSERDGLAPYYQLTDAQPKTMNIGDMQYQRIVRAKVTIQGGNGYRLPTEAEWEFACRAGTETSYYFGNELKDEQANVRVRRGFPHGVFVQRTAPVGSYPANAFGLYDMHGNVAEWCQDRFERGYVQELGDETELDPTGSEWKERNQRVTRGGSWNDDRSRARSSSRGGYPQSWVEWGPNARIGFRVARTASK